MERSLINYLILPKGVQSIFFKSYVYFVPFLYSLTIDFKYLQNFLLFLLIFTLFEFVINPSRYQLNDIADYKEDRQRHHHWERPVNQENESLILAIALSRFTIGAAIAFFLNVKLVYLVIAFLALQFFYDHFAKKFSPLLAIFAVSIAYPLRSLTVFYGLGMGLDKTSMLLLLSILLYSTYMVTQWRRHESLFITKNKLVPKSHSEFFSSHRIKFLIFPTLLVFLLAFILLIVSLIKIETNSAVIIYGISLLLVTILSFSSKDTLKKIIAQSHNIIIAFLFIVLILDRFFIGLAAAIISIFVIFWYHRIYAERFANNYFNETHYEKT